jgi:putative ABC transport system substrate-binding protein
MLNFRKLGLVALTSMAAVMPVMSQDVPVVKLSYIVDHPAINATRDGIIKALADAGYAEGTTLDLEVQNAQGSMPTQVQINDGFVAKSPDLIIAISTPSAQTAMSATSDIPIVFAAVTDPLGAGLVDSYEAPGRNLTGSSDRTPIYSQLELIKQIVPTAASVGVIYNSGEANSVAQVDEIKIEAQKLGLAIVEATATQSSAVPDAARSLVGKVDAIFAPTDSTVISAIEAVVRVGEEADLPVFAGDTGSVERGALAALGLNYFDIGLLAGQLAVVILNGAEPATLPVVFANKFELYVNPKAAAEMGITLSEEVVEQAAVVVE